MQSRYRNGAREFAVVLFCLLGITVLNSFAHNKFRGIPNPIPTIKKAFGYGDVRRGFTSMTLYELLNNYVERPQEVEAMKGVAIKGQILKEKATDPLADNPSQAEKVGDTFRLSRRFSENGQAEGSHVLSVKVSYPKAASAGLEANAWILVQGKVVRDPDSDPAQAQPMIQAESVSLLSHAPENPILTPQGDQEPAHADDHGDDHAGHSH